MPYFLLAAALLALAALLWYAQAAGKPAPACAQSPAPPDIPPQTLEALYAAVAALWELMRHPTLGGPGYLSLRFSPQDGSATVTAQYPNIRGVLYRRIVRQELSPEVLLGEGFPASLLALSPEFEAESGGVAALTVELRNVDLALAAPALDYGERKAALSTLANRLEARFPELDARCVGGEVLLTPVREGESAPIK